MSVAGILDSMDYGPAPESREIVDAWLAALKPTTRLFIGGQWRQAKSKSCFETINPATGEVLGTLAEAGDADVASAVKAARAAQPGWAALSGHARARTLYAIARLLQKHARFFSVLESLDNGKPIRESRDIDIPLAARHFYHHAGWAQLSDTELAGHEPIGVIGQIIPWNFPTLILAWKIAPAIAAGNTVVLKPAEFTSLTALRFAELCQEAGLPDGVVNIVTGAGATGSSIVSHPDIDKIAFTGSTEVGRLIRRQTAGSGKKLSLELGGKSPFIVFDDADLDSAVEGLVDAIWFNQGEVCCAGSRLLVQESIADRFLGKVRDRMAKLRLGDPLDKSIDVGAIIDESQRRAIDALVKRGVDEGATIWQPDIDFPQQGCFYPPTLLTDVSPVSTVCQEEIFGPVLVSMTFRTPAEAVEIANNTRYGLAASVWSENINLALGVAPAIKAGVIWINCTNQFDAACGFGGYRESGFGREGGREGMDEYLKPILRKRPPVLKLKKAGELAKDTKIEPTGVDRTAKMYIGGKQTRPDSGYSRQVVGQDGTLHGHVGDGNRKDIRNGVEAARKAEGWGRHSAHGRAQILYFLAENLAVRRDEFQKRLRRLTGVTAKNAAREVDASISRLFSYAAWADKFDGAVHTPPLRSLAIAMNEPVGIVGIACPDEAPLLSFISLVAPAIAMGCRVVVIPSELFPLVATDFYQIIETSDLPAGVVNIVTGDRDTLIGVLAEHDQVDAVWYFGPLEGSEWVERASAGNLKRTWVNDGLARDWFDDAQGEGREFLRHATQVKNVWVPYGE